MSNPKKIVQYKKEKLDLVCRWGDCNASCTGDLVSFSKHAASHVIGRDIFFCEWMKCGSVFTDSVQLAKHLSFHAHHEKLLAHGRNFVEERALPPCTKNKQPFTRDPEIPLQCQWEDCDVVFSDVVTFYAHLEWHSMLGPRGNNPEQLLRCGWKGCSVNFGTTYKLRAHARIHTEEKLVACPTCELTFTCRAKMVDHLHRQQKEDGEFKCSHCLKTFATKRILKDHVRRHVNYYRCNVCGMTMSSPAAIANHHLYRHQNERPYKCYVEGCTYAAKREYDFIRHLETHKTTRDVLCPTEGCSERFRSKACLKAHVKKVHTDGEKRRYLCHLCGGKWARATSLTKHLRKQHKVSVPGCFTRYSYARGADGFYRMQLVRLEAVDVHEEIEPHEVAILGGEAMDFAERDLQEAQDDVEAIGISEHEDSRDSMHHPGHQAEIDQETRSSTYYDDDEEGDLKIFEEPDVKEEFEIKEEPGSRDDTSIAETDTSYVSSGSATIGCDVEVREQDSTSEYSTTADGSGSVSGQLPEDDEDLEAYVENGAITVIHNRPLKPGENVLIQLEDVEGIGKRAKVRIRSLNDPRLLQRQQ